MSESYDNIRAMIAEGFELFDFDDFCKQIENSPVLLREAVDSLIVNEDGRRQFHLQMALLYASVELMQKKLDDHVQKYHGVGKAQIRIP